MQTILKSDWAPTLQHAAQSLAPVVAVAIVAWQWAQFTWRRPWAGLMALAVWRPAPAAAPVAVEAAPLLLLPVAPLLLLAAAPEPIPAPVAAPARKRGRRATRQSRAAA